MKIAKAIAKILILFFVSTAAFGQIQNRDVEDAQVFVDDGVDDHGGSIGG